MEMNKTKIVLISIIAFVILGTAFLAVGFFGNTEINGVQFDLRGFTDTGTTYIPMMNGIGHGETKVFEGEDAGHRLIIGVYDKAEGTSTLEQNIHFNEKSSGARIYYDSSCGNKTGIELISGYNVAFAYMEGDKIIVVQGSDYSWNYGYDVNGGVTFDDIVGSTKVVG